MKLIIFLTFLALARASPLRIWDNQGGQIAHQVTDRSIYDQMVQTNAVIKNLEWKMQQHPHTWIDHTRTLNSNEMAPYFWHETGVYTDRAPGAIHYLQKNMEHPQGTVNIEEQLMDSHESVKDHLYDTIKTGIEAQMTARLAEQQGVAHGVFVPLAEGLHPEVFDLKVQKLIDENNKEDIVKQISYHHHCAQQLHEQQEFVTQQKHQIETQQLLARTKGVHEQVYRLEQVHHQLQAKEYNLMKEQLVHHVAMLKLQRALINMEEKILQGTVAEQMKERLMMRDSYPLRQQFWSY